MKGTEETGNMTGFNGRLGKTFMNGSYTRSDAGNSMAALGGVNFYLPGGSFDITVSLGNNSMYSLMIGYTLYLTRK